MRNCAVGYFRIDEPYPELVGNDKAGFLALIQGQFLSILNTEPRNIPLEKMDARSGSTIVTMTVLGYNDEEAAELEKDYSDLSKLFEDGKVELVSPTCVIQDAQFLFS